MSPHRPVTSRLFLAALLAACSTEPSTPPAGPTDSAEPAGEPPTWSDDVLPVVEAHCTGCHFDGGAAPFAMQTHAQVAPLAEAALAAIDAGSMPPWMPDPDCRSFEGERLMPAGDRDLFAAWVEAGAPEGEPTGPIVLDSEVLVPDLVGQALDPYTPDLESQGDDYQCFVLDLDFEEDVYLSGTQVIPGSPAVHHVLVYALTGEQIEQMEAADAADPGPGYTCFGGPLGGDGGTDGNILSSAGGFPNQIGSWVPGAVPVLFEDDQGIRIVAGSKVVMQVHYSAAGAAPSPDLTRYELALHDTPPAQLVSTRPFAVIDLDIPAGEPEVEFSRTVRNWSDQDVTLGSVTGHMHLLGKRLKVEVIRADGAEECALELPEWDFEWQQAYQLPDDDRITLAPGDGLRLSCTYDNSAENQPVVNGEQQEPRDVTWGEGSLDEMCLTYLGVIEDFSPTAPAPDSACPSSDGCLTDCAADDLDCLLTCETVESSCVACSVQAGLSCGLTSCAPSLVAIQDCITTCLLGNVALGGSLGACLDAECGAGVEDFAACAQPTLDSGACDAAFADCGVAL